MMSIKPILQIDFDKCDDVQLMETIYEIFGFGLIRAQAYCSTNIRHGGRSLVACFATAMSLKRLQVARISAKTIYGVSEWPNCLYDRFRDRGFEQEAAGLITAPLVQICGPFLWRQLCAVHRRKKHQEVADTRPFDRIVFKRTNAVGDCPPDLSLDFGVFVGQTDPRKLISRRFGHLLLCIPKR